MTKQVVIIDDEPTIRLSLKLGLEDEGFLVWAEETGELGLERVLKVKPELVFLDIRLPGKDGLEILSEIKAFLPETVVVMMTAYGDTQTILEALKKGAFDYVNKPFELEEVLILIDRVINTEKLSRELAYYREHADEDFRKNQIICASHSMLTVLDTIQKIAPSKTNVLITGQTGTGKELAAKAIHYQSQRREKSFIELNCGAIPQNLLESELFGYEKAAFTGADKSKMGLLELAHEGTLFLDEIGEIPLELQVKLLRFLEDQKIRRVGSTHTIQVDVRIIAATNRDLREMVETRRFRSDLYYRLSVVPIHLPSLRERGEDIRLLAEYFLSIYDQKFKKEVPGFSPAVLDLFRNYSWPGNVRELKNLVERLVLLNQGTLITPSQLPEEIVMVNTEPADSISLIPPIDKEKPWKQGFSLDEELQLIEKFYIQEVLSATQWNMSKAAKILGISRFSLQRRVKKLFEEAE